MLFVSFLRYSPINSHFPEGNNFGGLVLFLCRQSFFSRAFFRVALRGPVGTLPATYGSRETSVVRVLAAPSRWDWLHFRGCESEPKKPSPRHDTGKGTLSSEVHLPSRFLIVCKIPYPYGIYHTPYFVASTSAPELCQPHQTDTYLRSPHPFRALGNHVPEGNLVCICIINCDFFVCFRTYLFV